MNRRYFQLQRIGFVARRVLAGLLAAICLFRLATASYCQETSFTEYHVKALFLFNFAKYVQWPERAFPDSNAPITIGVIGQDNFGQDLPAVVRNKTVGGRTFVIRHLSVNDDPKGCQILFIGASESSHVEEILDRVGSQPILTVGEDRTFWKAGGIVNFVLKDGNVRLEINLDSANKAGLKLSSKLLAVADLVKGKAVGP